MAAETAESSCRALERALHDLSIAAEDLVYTLDEGASVIRTSSLALLQSYESDAAAQGPSPPPYTQPISQIPSAQHQPFYRVISEDSPDGNSAGDLLPRYWPLPDLPCQKHIERLVRSHCERERTPTPFTSLTPDLLRAFNYAMRLDGERKKKIEILVIDPWKLPNGSCVSCKQLMTRLCLDGTKFKTEYLVWGRVPAAAIESRWMLEDIKRSQLFTILPSLADTAGKKRLDSVRDRMVEDAEWNSNNPQRDDCVVQPLVSIVVRQWCRKPQLPTMMTWWSVMTMLGWWKGYIYPGTVQDLGRLSELLGDKVDLIDRELDWEYRQIVNPLLRRMTDKEPEHCLSDMSVTKQGFQNWRTAMEREEGVAYQQREPFHCDPFGLFFEIIEAWGCLFYSCDACNEKDRTTTQLVSDRIRCEQD
jgi:hypothetical protein